MRYRLNYGNGHRSCLDRDTPSLQGRVPAWSMLDRRKNWTGSTKQYERHTQIRSLKHHRSNWDHHGLENKTVPILVEGIVMLTETFSYPCITSLRGVRQVMQRSLSQSRAAWASEGFLPGEGTRGFFQYFSREGQNWRKFVFFPLGSKKTTFFSEIFKTQEGQGPHASLFDVHAERFIILC